MLSFKISQKLMLLVGISILAFVISQGYSMLIERQNTLRLKNVEQRLYPTLELTTINLGSLLLMEQQINSSVTTGDEQALETAEQHYKDIRTNLNKISGLSDEFKGRASDIEKLLITWHDTAVRIAKDFISGKVDMSRVATEAAANAERLKSLKQALVDMKTQTTQAFTDSISQTVDSSQTASSVAGTIALFAIIVMVVISAFISRSITDSIKQVANSLREMSSGDGDLTKRIHYVGRDEVGDLVNHFNQFVTKLHSSFADVTRDVSDLGYVASRLTKSSGQNLHRINDQANAIAGMRSSIEKLLQTVNEVAEFASSASVQAQDASGAAARGKETLSTNVATISTLADEVRSAADVVNQFETFSTDVGHLLNTIQNVAEQTNLLALNAAIEAARAGEHGRGFAVVADEVRGLAVRTRQATEEIHKVINELRKVSANAVTAMQGSVERANRGLDATRASGEVLNSILSNVETIRHINERIADATQEQTQTFSHVSQHVNEIYHNTQLVTSSTNELDEVSRDIDHISQGLGNISSQFKV